MRGGIEDAMRTDSIPEFKASEFYQKTWNMIEGSIAERALEIEGWTTAKICDVIMQAIECGDIKIKQLVTSQAIGRSVVYIPFARQQELEAEITRLTDLLDKNGIEHRKAYVEL